MVAIQIAYVVSCISLVLIHIASMRSHRCKKKM